MGKKVYVHYVRHGQTMFNRLGRMQGWCDSPLEKAGIEDARRAKEALKDVDLKRAYTSTSERCIDTAHIVLEGRDVPLYYTKKLREICWGEYEAFLISDDPEEIDRRRLGDCDWTDVGGENPQIAVARVKEVFDQIFEEAEDGDHVLVVSHGAILMHMMRLLMGIDLKKLFEILRKKGKMRGVVVNGYAADLLLEDGEYKLLDLKGNGDLFEQYKKNDR